MNLCNLDLGLSSIVKILQPQYIVELGTGAGTTAAQIMAVLPPFSKFITINWANPPSGDPVGIKLEPWKDDPRLKQIIGDTRDPNVAAQVPDGIELLFIDSGTKHEYALISVEWEIYRPKLVDGAIVVCDDINHNDMRKFWNPLPYEKIEIWMNQAGLFRYKLKHGECNEQSTSC